jgi:hypothetical protein
VLLGASALGFALAWLAHPPFLHARLPLPMPASWWAADRDVGALEGLDEGLRPCARVLAPFPVRVAATGDGGAWLACAVAGGTHARHELWRIDAAARRTERYSLGELVDLAAAPSGAAFALVVRGPDHAALVRFARAGPVHVIAEVPVATCVAADEGHVAIGRADARLVLLSHDGLLVDELALGGACTDVAAADGGWSVVTGNELERRGHALDLRWSAPLALERPRLGEGPGAFTWVYDELGQRLLRVGADGRIELDLVSPVRSLRAVAARADGSALVATDGALLCVTRAGEWRIGQGGFDALVDVCAAR